MSPTFASPRRCTAHPRGLLRALRLSAGWTDTKADPPLALLQLPVQAGQGLLVGLGQGDGRPADFGGSLSVKLLQAHQFDLLMFGPARTEGSDQGRVGNTAAGPDSTVAPGTPSAFLPTPASAPMSQQQNSVSPGWWHSEHPLSSRSGLRRCDRRPRTLEASSPPQTPHRPSPAPATLT